MSDTLASESAPSVEPVQESIQTGPVTISAELGAKAIHADAPQAEEPAAVVLDSPSVEQGVSFLDQLPQELRGEPTLQNFKDIEGLAKTVVNQQKMLGGMVRIPNENASQELMDEFNNKMEKNGYVKMPSVHNKEDMAKFMDKLGRPKTPDEYNLSAPEGVAVDTGALNSYKQFAHQIGLTKQQAAALLEYDINRGTQSMEFSLNTAKSALKESWGEEYDTRLNLSKEAMKHMESKYPNAVKELRNGPAGNNPAVLHMAAELGRMYKEAGIVTGNRSVKFNLTPDEAMSRIRDIKSGQDKLSKPYTDNKDKHHKAAVEEVEKLYKMAYSTKG